MANDHSTRSYCGEPVTVLPFVADTPEGRTFWVVPDARDYSEACALGEQYAIEYLRYCRDNNTPPFLLGWIARDVGTDNDSPNRGYWIGFLFVIESLARSVSPERYAKGGA